MPRHVHLGVFVEALVTNVTGIDLLLVRARWRHAVYHFSLPVWTDLVLGTWLEIHLHGLIIELLLLLLLLDIVAHFLSGFK